MRRFLQYISLVAIITLLTGCEWDDGGTRDKTRIGKYLWDLSSHDLGNVNDTFDFIGCYNYLINIEDEAEREQYKSRHFGNATITVAGNTHKITYSTYYDTLYSVTIEMTADHWRVTRSGGNGYALTIKPSTDDHYTVDIERLYHNESTGYGKFEVAMEYDGDMPVFEYAGKLVMIDRTASDTLPLTITTETIKAIHYSRLMGMKEGKISIKAYDALYDTTDTATVTILKFERKIIVESMGTNTGYYI